VGGAGTLGGALLNQHSRLPALCLPEPADCVELCREEEARYGITHAGAAARVLAAWHFPTTVCEPIARHHDALLPDAPVLERGLHVARALADRAMTDEPIGFATDDGIAWLTEGRLTAADVEPLLARLREKADGLLQGLRPT
jgi:HD-like signal output (HDOD) protein